MRSSMTGWPVFRLCQFVECLSASATHMSFTATSATNRSEEFRGFVNAKDMDTRDVFISSHCVVEHRHIRFVSPVARSSVVSPDVDVTRLAVVAVHEWQSSMSVVVVPVLVSCMQWWQGVEGDGSRGPGRF